MKSVRVCISTRLTYRGTGIPIGMKQAVRALRKYVNIIPSCKDTEKFTLEKHPSLLHFTVS